MSDESQLSEEEIAAVREALTTLFESIGNPTGGRCFQCKQQIGGCVYFHPCGHHYQGKLPVQAKGKWA